MFPTKNAAEDAASLAVDSGKCLGGRRAHHLYAVRETQIFLHKKPSCHLMFTCNRGFFMEIFPETVKNFYRKNGEHLDPRQDFLRLIRGWSCPFWAVHWKWRICCRTNWDRQRVAAERHGVFFCCCWKEQTNNEIRTNKIEEAKETWKDLVFK